MSGESALGAEAIRTHPLFPVIALLARKCAEGMIADNSEIFDLEDVIKLLKSYGESAEESPTRLPQIDALVGAAIYALSAQLDELRRVWHYSALFHERYILYAKKKNDAKSRFIKNHFDKRKNHNDDDNANTDDDDNINNNYHNDDDNNNGEDPSEYVGDTSSYDDNEASTSQAEIEENRVKLDSLTNELWRQIAEHQQNQRQYDGDNIASTGLNDEVPTPSSDRKRRLPFDAERLINEKTPRLDVSYSEP